MTAYSHHHHAHVIRPDDVWLALVSLFCLYINANAELQRANFVAHAGKRELEVHGPFLLDFPALATRMSLLLDKNIQDLTQVALQIPNGCWAHDCVVSVIVPNCGAS
ncbi:hypothetical protein B0H19DRAFT_1272635 [Mycena capillaripes]|nr:hypothetical protein B0H19DRAFT_1272376 [Mycena capillaripes]KAJ6533248.1 hypothetical protein B0H19DRAFT_1272635 [Mycena capillaripes]